MMADLGKVVYPVRGVEYLGSVVYLVGSVFTVYPHCKGTFVAKFGEHLALLTVLVVHYVLLWGTLAFASCT